MLHNHHHHSQSASVVGVSSSQALTKIGIQIRAHALLYRRPTQALAHPKVHTNPKATSRAHTFSECAYELRTFCMNKNITKVFNILHNNIQNFEAKRRRRSQAQIK